MVKYAFKNIIKFNQIRKLDKEFQSMKIPPPFKNEQLWKSHPLCLPWAAGGFLYLNDCYTATAVLFWPNWSEAAALAFCLYGPLSRRFQNCTRQQITCFHSTVYMIKSEIFTDRARGCSRSFVGRDCADGSKIS